jgi:hypothetical protein
VGLGTERGRAVGGRRRRPSSKCRVLRRVSLPALSLSEQRLQRRPRAKGGVYAFAPTISFSIPTINFVSTNNYSYTHSTVFRVINSDTLYLRGERRGPTRRRRCRGTAAAIGCPLRGACKGRGDYYSPTRSHQRVARRGGPGKQWCPVDFRFLA